MSLSSIGLVLIVFGWVAQILFVRKGRKEVSSCFLVLYMVGCLSLAFDAFSSNLRTIAWLNLGCVAGAAVVAMKTGLKCRSPCCCSASEKVSEKNIPKN